jgi:hypothetical protein
LKTDGSSLNDSNAKSGFGAQPDTDNNKENTVPAPVALPKFDIQFIETALKLPESPNEVKNAIGPNDENIFGKRSDGS